MNATISAPILGLGSQLRSRSVNVRKHAVRAPMPRSTGLVVSAKKEEESQMSSKVGSFMLAGAMLFSSLSISEEAMAANTSGRAGGRGGFSSRSAARAPPAAAPQAAPSVTNVTVVQQPPMFSPFGGFGMGMGMGMGYSPFGGFGMGVPVFGFGSSIIALFLFLFIIQVLFSFVASMFGGRDDDMGPPPPRKNNNKFDDF